MTGLHLPLTFEEWLDGLEAVAVEWAPAHSAPYVSRDIVHFGMSAYIERAVAAERARITAAVEGLPAARFTSIDGGTFETLTRAAVLRIIEEGS